MLSCEQLEVSHYAKRADAPNVSLRLSSAKSLLNTITKNFGTLPFCRRYLDRLGQEKYLLGVGLATTSENGSPPIDRLLTPQ